jgi:hypothetical protein
MNANFINKINKNIQVEGKYTAELRDATTGKVKQRVTAKNYINPLLYLAHKYMGHGAQIATSASDSPAALGRDLIFDAPVLGVSSVFDNAPAGTSATHPGTFISAMSSLFGKTNTFAFNFGPNQSNGVIRSLFSGAATAGPSGNNPLTTFSPVAVDYGAPFMATANDIAVNSNLFPTGTARNYVDFASIPASTKSYTVAGLPPTATIAGYDTVTNGLIFYDASATSIYVTDTIDNLPSLTVESTISVAAVTAAHRTGDYIKTGDNIYVSNATAITSGIFNTVSQTYTVFEAAKWQPPAINAAFLPGNGVTAGATGLCPAYIFQFFTGSDHFVYTPYAAFNSATNIITYAVKIADLYTTLQVSPWIVQRYFAPSGAIYVSSPALYIPDYDCYAAMMYSNAANECLGAKRTGSVAANLGAMGKVILPEEIVKTEAYGLNITYEVTVDYGVAGA